MAILDKIKIGVDVPNWLQLKPMPVTNAAGSCMYADKRNSIWNDNGIYSITAAANLYRTSKWYNGSMLLTGSLTLPAFGAGVVGGFCPAFGIYGNITTGCTTTKIVTSSATTAGSAIAALGVNQLVKTDMPYSYMIRIIGKTSGLTEQRTIVGNTASATPTFYLDEPLTFTPASGDLFEVISGVTYNIAPTTTQAGQTRYYGVANNSVGNAGATGITTAAVSAAVFLDEALVPFDMSTGEGLILGDYHYDSNGLIDIHALTATGAAPTTLTGSVAGGDSVVLANEYRNFQIRIVEDTTNPTANGQRRQIASHTGGASPVYTIGTAWTVTPSATAKYVIELPNVILLQNSTQAGMLTYNTSPYALNNGTATLAAFTWSTTYFNATHGAAIAAGAMAFPSYSHQPAVQTDGTKLSRHSYCYFFRGNSATLDRFDIAGAINGLWADNITYNNPISFTIGSCGDIDTVTFDGEYAYIVAGATALCYQFNIACPSLIPWAQLPVQSGTAADSKRCVVMSHIPAEPFAPALEVTPEDKLGMIYVQSHLGTNLYRSDIIG